MQHEEETADKGRTEVDDEEGKKSTYESRETLREGWKTKPKKEKESDEKVQHK